MASPTALSESDQSSPTSSTAISDCGMGMLHRAWFVIYLLVHAKVVGLAFKELGLQLSASCRGRLKIKRKVVSCQFSFSEEGCFLLALLLRIIMTR
ncbi:hypothetical protein F2Q68_00008156 [Brassica cretica]|uniref:Uncharacterized protein n=1 Tax=Brassica cretica TaxID=69181 RepID=A0A8S9KR62_BRACR|nr:hypothetical protein F2Q68_00008156 [Brassica cretica]